MLAATVALTAVVTPAFSEEANMLGVGNMQCSQLTQTYANAPGKQAIQMLDLMVGSWSSGFMSAVNMSLTVSQNDTKNLLSIGLDQQIITIRRYCKQHSNKQVVDAVAELFQSLTSNADGQ
jgi:hypothetical protein